MDEQTEHDDFCDSLTAAAFEHQRTNYPPPFEELCRMNEEWDREQDEEPASGEG